MDNEVDSFSKITMEDMHIFERQPAMRIPECIWYALQVSSLSAVAKTVYLYIYSAIDADMSNAMLPSLVLVSIEKLVEITNRKPATVKLILEELVKEQWIIADIIEADHGEQQSMYQLGLHSSILTMAAVGSKI